MATYSSERIHVAASPAAVFARLSDPTNLAPSEKVSTTANSVSAELPMVGRMTLSVVERRADEFIRLQAEDTPLPLTIAISIEPEGEGNSVVQLTLETPLSPFMQAVVDRPIKEALAKMGDKMRQLSFSADNDTDNG